MTERGVQQIAVTKSSVIWNMVGSGISALSSFILLMCVTRTVGAGDGGIFSVAFASAQLLLTLGKYGVRSYQATDVKRLVSFQAYLLSRILSCAAMMLCSFLFVFACQYMPEKAGVTVAVCLMKMVDAVEDVYHGQLQLDNRLDLAGKLLTFRNVFTMAFFAFLMAYTKNLLISCWTAGVVSMAVCLLINNGAARKFERIGLKCGKGELGIINKACLPLFLGSFLSLLIYNAPKYAIDMFCPSEIQTYYSIIFMPAFVINLFSEFVFKPLLTTLASWWQQKEYRKFINMILKLLGNISALTCFVLVAVYFCGTQLLSLFYGVDVNRYKTELLLLMLGGGFSAAVYFLYNVLTAMRKQKIILQSYLAGVVLIYILAFSVIRTGGILAAAVSYVVAEGILCVLMLLGTAWSIKRQKEGIDK